MRHMRWSWRELMETPMPVVEAVLMDLEARGRAQEVLSQWKGR